MWFRTAQITNYKSFKDSGEINLSRGMNVIIGANDVGKSALLEALSLRFSQKPHRSITATPTPYVPVDQYSVCHSSQ